MRFLGSTKLSLRAALWVSLLGGGCSVPRLDFTSKACPCAEGWICDEPSNQCVRGAAAAGDASAARDSGPGSQMNLDDASSLQPRDASFDEGGADSGGSRADAAPSSEAGPGDAALSDAASSADAFVADASSAWLCEGRPSSSAFSDGFEGYGGFTYGYSGTGSTLDTRHAGFAHSGMRSLRVWTEEPGRAASVSEWLDDPIMECSFSVSTYLYVDAAVQVQSFAVLAVGEQTGQAIRLLYTQTGLQLQVDATASTFAIDPQVELTGRWVHVELTVKVGLEGELSLLVDGNEALRVTTDTQRPLGYSQLRLGVFSTGEQQGPVVLYADDFRLTRVIPASL